MFVAAIMYADDLALLAPTRKSMQRLLDICHEYGIDWCITYNPTKTKVLIFGKSITPAPLYLNDLPITIVSSYKYLGVNLLAGKRFDTPIRKPLMSFYCSTNTILNVLNKPNENVLMKLLYSNCIPILTRELRKSLGYESITEIFAKRNSRFLNGISRTGISVLIQIKSLS